MSLNIFVTSRMWYSCHLLEVQKKVVQPYPQIFCSLKEVAVLSHPPAFAYIRPVLEILFDCRLQSASAGIYKLGGYLTH
jgi:hypothetical protein